MNNFFTFFPKCTTGYKDYNVYLYQPDSTGKPGKILFKKHIMTDSVKKEGVINIANFNIKIPQTGIFIGLENLKIYDYIKDNQLHTKGLVFKCTNKFKNSVTYFSVKDSNISTNKIWIKNYTAPAHETPRFGLEVYRK